MARYLVVPDRSAASETLLRRVREVSARDPAAGFTLLVPTPPGNGNRQVAAHLAAVNALLLRTRFTQAQLAIERTEIGDSSPVLAIEDELRARPAAYDAVILATRAPGVARAFALDAHSRADRLPLPVMHVCEGEDRPLAVPLVYRLRALLHRASAPLGALLQAVIQRPRLGIAIIAAPMLTYLALGLGLALIVNRRFLFNDAVALTLFTTLLCGLLLIERLEARAAQRRRMIEQALRDAIDADITEEASWRDN